MAGKPSEQCSTIHITSCHDNCKTVISHYFFLKLEIPHSAAFNPVQRYNQSGSTYAKYGLTDGSWINLLSKHCYDHSTLRKKVI